MQINPNEITWDAKPAKLNPNNIVWDDDITWDDQAPVSEPSMIDKGKELIGQGVDYAKGLIQQPADQSLQIDDANIIGTPIPEGAKQLPSMIAVGKMMKDLYTGKPLPKGAGYLQKPMGWMADTLDKVWTVEDEKKFRAKHPNLAAGAYALSSVILPGVGEKVYSPEEREKFAKKSKPEQELEILGLTASYVAFGAAAKLGREGLMALGKKFPVLTKPIGEAIMKSAWFKRLNIKMRGKTLNTAEKMNKAGMSDAEIARKLMKEQKMSGLEVEKELEAMKGIKRKPSEGTQLQIEDGKVKPLPSIPKRPVESKPVQKPTELKPEKPQPGKEVMTFEEAHKLIKSGKDLPPQTFPLAEMFKVERKKLEEAIREAEKLKEKPVKAIEPKEQLTTPIKAEKPKVEPSVKAEKVKEPWEMTSKEWLGEEFDKYPFVKAGNVIAHKKAVQKALSEGKPIPQEVLKDYPDLTPKPKAPVKGKEPIGVAKAVESVLEPHGSALSQFAHGKEKLTKTDINVRTITTKRGIEHKLNAYTYELTDGRKRIVLAKDPTNLIDAGAIVKPVKDGVIIESLHGGKTGMPNLGGTLAKLIKRRFGKIIPDSKAPLSPVGRKATEKLQAPKPKAPVEKQQKEYASPKIKTKPKKAIPSPKYTPIPKGKRHSAILRDIEKKLKVPIRIGGFRKKVGGMTRGGIYKPGAHIIRMAKANDIPVAMHEIGHAVEKLLGLPKTMPPEVQTMAYPGAKNLDREGFAEFLRMYATEPGKAKRGAPKFHKDFEEALSKQPELQDILITVRQAWKEFQAAPSVSRVGSFIVRGGKRGRRMSINRLYTEVKDNLWPLAEAVDFAKAKGKVFNPSEDPYKMSRLMRGWPRKAEQYLTTGTFQYDAGIGIKETGKSLKDILKPIERAGEMELLDIYLVAKRATTDPRVSKGFNRILSKADFNQTVIELEPKFGKVGEQLQKYNDELLKFLRDSGRISNDVYKTIKAKNPFYAPLYRLFDSDVSPKNVGQKAGNIFNPIKKLKGSSRDIYSPTESLLYNTYVMINSAERTRVGNAIRELAKVEGMGQFIDRVPFRQKPTKVNKDDFLKLLHQYGKFEQVRTVRQSEKIINNELRNFAETPTSKVEGRVIEALTARGWTEAESKQILTRIKGTKEDGRNDIVEKIVEKTTIMTIKEELGFANMPNQVIASFRPDIKAGKSEVILYNKGKPELYEIIDKDLYEAVANIDAGDLHLFIKVLAYPAKWLRAGATTFSPEFAIRNPLRDQMTAWIQTKYGYVPGIDFLRGVFHMMGKTEVWKKFNAGGGAHAVITSIDRNYLHKDLKSIFKEKSVLRLARNPLEVLQRISEYTEEATRVGEAAKAFKREGASYEAMLKGAFAGREVSLDFMRQGRTAARSLNMISAFWNARIEGLDKMARSFKDQPIKTAMKAFLGITLPSVLLWYAQKDDPYYNELPAWRRTLFWNFVFHNDDGSLKFILPIPKPFEYGLIFGSIPEAALDWAYTKSPDLFKETMETVGESANILPMPTAAVPIIEWYGNRSMFFERPLVPRGKEDLDPYLQSKGTTSETVKIVAKLMNEVPVLKMVASPAKIENMIMGYTAAMGRLALDAGDWLIEELGVVEVPPDTEMKLSDLPGIRAFRVRFPSGNTRSIEQFYTKYIAAKQKWESDKERKGLRGKGLKIDKPTGVALGMSVELIKYEMGAKVLTLLRKSANMVYESKTMTPKEKTESLNGIYLNMINVARAALQKKKIKL